MDCFSEYSGDTCQLLHDSVAIDRSGSEVIKRDVIFGDAQFG